MYHFLFVFLFLFKYKAYIHEKLIDCQVSFDILYYLMIYSNTIRANVLEESRQYYMSWVEVFAGMYMCIFFN